MEPPDKRGRCKVEQHEPEEFMGDVGSPALDQVFTIGADEEPVICGRRWHCGCDEAPPE
ncbi:hypothetical protein [Corallococcus sp. CA031C]|uniref:hypothetical protein n=1 Tax=Corallococcus sp. CA031C TaxID=2316725 RepID=UPI001315ACA3|nr:hypothetical protein [Corallococcus sp. CA031C]